MGLFLGTGEVAQQVKVPAAKPDDMSSISGTDTHGKKERTQLSLVLWTGLTPASCPLRSYVLWHVPVRRHTLKKHDPESEGSVLAVELLGFASVCQMGSSFCRVSD